jgi:uncharacterized membrane protein YjjB (DUF3815 family)
METWPPGVFIGCIAVYVAGVLIADHFGVDRQVTYFMGFLAGAAAIGIRNIFKEG